MVIFKKLFVNSMLAGFGILIALLLLEGGLRLLVPVSERGIGATHRPDDQLGWTYIANSEQWYTSPGEFRNHIVINRNGLRDEPIAYEKKQDTYRVMMLGDSFVAGFQAPLSQTFAKITEARLDELDILNDQRVEVLNAGTGGYGTDQELRWFRKEGIKYTPDMVVLVIFLGNDIADNDFELSALAAGASPAPKPFFHLQNGQLQDMGFSGVRSDLSGDREVSVLSIRRILQKYSHAYALASALIVRLEGHPTFQAILHGLGRAAASDTYNHAYDIFADSPPAAWKRAWRLTERLILTLKEEVESQDAEFGVVMIPHPVQVHEDWWSARLALYPAMEQMQWDLTLPNARLAHFFEEHQISYLDLQPLLKEYAARTGDYLYFRNDGHFTVHGNRVVGEAIAEWLARTLGQ